jgi:hypothetical protein
VIVETKDLSKLPFLGESAAIVMNPMQSIEAAANNPLKRRFIEHP